MPLQYPSQGYAVRAKLHLIVRLDEYAQDSTLLKPKSPTVTTRNLNGTLPQRIQLTPQPDPQNPGALILLPAGESPSPGSSPQQRTRSTDGFTFDLEVIPKNLSWQQNGPRTADTLKATIRYLDLPIDPRLVRMCAVEGYLGCMPGDMVAGEADGTVDSPNLLPDNFTGPNGELRTNLRFQGFVDKWRIEWGTKEPIIQLDCRDNKLLLLDQENPPRLVIDMNKPLDVAIAAYMSNFLQFAGMSVIYRPVGDPVPVLANVLAHTAFRPQLGPHPSATGAGGEKMKVWDYLEEVVRSIGHSIRVEGTLVIIQRTRSLMGNQSAARVDDPFQGRTIPNMGSFPYRRFIFGRNIKELTIERDFPKAQPPNVEIRCFSTAQKKVLVGRFPVVSGSSGPTDVGDRQVTALPGNGTVDQKWIVREVSGIEDEKVLRALAQEVYESESRSEITVEIETRSMASFGGGDSDPDVLDLKFADTFELLVVRDEDQASSLTNIEKSLTSQMSNQRFMKALGMSDDFAAAYAKAYTNAGFLTVFRVKTLSANYDQGRVTLKITGINYIEVRADKSLPEGEEPGNVINTKGSPS